ncbi:aldo/keto reductase [Rhizobium laguerreae]
MSKMQTRAVTAQGLQITTMGLGGTGLGNMYRATDPAVAHDTVHAAFNNGLRYFDTAPVYGFGLAETRLGQAIQTLPRSEIVISSKVGYDLVPIPGSEVRPVLWDGAPPFRADFDYSRDAVMRSIEGSLKRLQTDYIDMLAIHDPDEAIHFQPGEDPYARSRFKEAMEGAYPTLDDLRSQGVVKAIGVGINQWQMLSDFVEAGQFDYFLVAGRYTLLEQEPLATLFPACEKKGTKIVMGGGGGGAAVRTTPAFSPQDLSRMRRSTPGALPSQSWTASPTSIPFAKNTTCPCLLPHYSFRWRISWSSASFQAHARSPNWSKTFNLCSGLSRKRSGLSSGTRTSSIQLRRCLVERATFRQLTTFLSYSASRASSVGSAASRSVDNS